MFGNKVFDGAGRLVSSGRGGIEETEAGSISGNKDNIVVKEPVSSLSIGGGEGRGSVSIPESSTPGFWKFEFYLNEHKYETSIEVVKQLVEQQIPGDTAPTTTQ